MSESESSEVKCLDCGKSRPKNAPDYHPTDAVLFGAVGWFSGEGEEFCGECMAKLLNMSNGTTHYYAKEGS